MKTMGQSLSKMFIHIIFHIKENSVKIRREDKNSLHAYMGSIVKDRDSIPIRINGVDDHVHILCVMSKNISLAKLVEEIKKHSSRWIKTKNSHYSKFAWQGGYGAFSVSSSLHDKTNDYIENQEKHHAKISFKEEYMMFLKEYQIDFNEKNTSGQTRYKRYRCKCVSCPYRAIIPTGIITRGYAPG